MNNVDIEESCDSHWSKDLTFTFSRFRGLVYHKYMLYFIAALSMIFFIIQIHILAWVLEKKWQAIHQVSILHMLDIGQGDAFIIEHYSGARIVIDMGTKTNIFMSQQFQDDCCIINYHKIRKTIDMLLLTHDDADHAAALVQLPTDMRIGNIITSPFTYSYIEKFKKTRGEKMQTKFAKQNIPKIISATNGFSFNLQSDTFEILFPFSHPTEFKSGYANTSRSASIFTSAATQTHIASIRPKNDDSIIMKTTLHKTKILFTGDSGFKTEAAILENQQTKKSIKNIDILKVGHHGSKHSTGKDFLAEIRPIYALISAGRKNTYGHPHKSVIKRIESAGTKIQNIFRTDTCGRVSFQIYKMGAIGHPDCKSISYDNKGLD